VGESENPYRYKAATGAKKYMAGFVRGAAGRPRLKRDDRFAVGKRFGDESVGSNHRARADTCVYRFRVH